MSVNSLRDLTLASGLKSSVRRARLALLPALTLLLCLTVPAWALVTPKQSDKNALVRIKRVNDTNAQLRGVNWTISGWVNYVQYDNVGGIAWNGVDINAQVANLYIGSNQLTGNLDATGMAALTWLEASNNQFRKLNVRSNPLLTTLYVRHNRLASLDLSKNTRLAELYVSHNRLTNLDVSKNARLAELYASHNRLTSLDMRQNAALTDLDASHNQLTALDVRKNTALDYFNASRNQLASLDVRQNTALTWLDVSGNQLTGLDVSKNTALTDLDASHNRLAGLDMSQNTALTGLHASHNQLASLNISQNTALAKLDASHNQLTGLDLRQNTALILLDASTNRLASLDVSQNAALARLDVSNNRLANLDVSQNAALEYLYASNNQLTGLSVNNDLSWLDVSGNQLASLDVRQNTALTGLDVSGNRLDSLDLTGLSGLRHLGIAETGLKLDDLHLPSYDQLWGLELDLVQLDQQDFSALPSLYELGIYDSKATEIALKQYSILDSGKVTAITITAREARSLDFGAYASNLGALDIRPGRLESIRGADGLDKTKFSGLAIGNNRLPLSRIAPLISAVNLNPNLNPGAAINVASQSQVWFESLTSRNKPFNLSAQLAPERTLKGKVTKFDLLPASAVTASPDGQVVVNKSLALKEGRDYTLSPNGRLKIAKTGQYYLLMSNPALYNWNGDNQGDILALSGLLDYQGRP